MNLTDITPFVKVEVPQAPDILIDAFTRIAAQEFARKTRLWSSFVDLTCATESTVVTPVPTDAKAALVIGSRVLTPENQYPLFPMNDAAFHTARMVDRDAGEPSGFFLRNGRIELDRTPLTARTWRFRIVWEPADNAATLDDIFAAPELKLGIADGAKALLMMQVGKEWSNEKQAALARANFYKAVNDAYVKFDTGRTEVEQRLVLSPWR